MIRKGTEQIQTILPPQTYQLDTNLLHALESIPAIL